MKINRHNYEEYFILYADKELSSDDRRMVEEFVSLNADLKDELDVYLNSVLLPDTSTSFDNKEELYHYDESLISYIDDELNVDEKIQLEKLLTTSPKLQQELELYKKTKLKPDTDMIFENKTVLYRSTERRRVVPMTIIRWSVAAAILFAIAITAVTILNRNSETTPPIVGANKPDQGVQKTNQESIATKKDKEQKVNPSLKNEDLQIGVAKKNEKKPSILTEKKKEKVAPIEEKPKENIAAIKTPSNNLPTPEYDALKTNATAYTEPVEGGQKNVNGSNRVTIPDPNPYNTIVNRTTTNDSDPGEEGGQNKKSRGFFRKLTRVLEKNTGIKATDDD